MTTGERVQAPAAKQAVRAPSVSSAPQFLDGTRSISVAGEDAERDAELLAKRMSGVRENVPTHGGGGIAPPSVENVVRSAGAPLDAHARAFFESRIGHDFSHVRVHTDARAAASAREVNARAYSVGAHIAFADGEYRPATFAGARLLAHELAHVVQHDASPHLHARLFRQPPPAAQPAPPRIVYLDANVFDQINRGNQAAATALQNLRSSGASLRVSNWTYREMVQQPAIPRTATANRLLIENLRITVDPQIPLPRRIDLALPIAGAAATALSDADRQVMVGARAGNGELWSFDGAFRSNASGVQATYGVRVATESQLPMATARADYRVGRRALGLPLVEISLSGVVRPPRPPGSGGTGGGRGGAPPEGRPPQRGGAAATTEAAPVVRPPVVQPTIPPPRVVPPASPALVIERTRLIATLEQQTARSAAFATRLQLYMRIGGALLQTLEMINTVGDVLQMANVGTVLPDEQRVADRVEQQSTEAEGRAQATYDSISLITSTQLVADAIARGDATALFDLSSALGHFGLEASTQALRYGELARDLHARARAIHALSEAFMQLAQVPQGASTAPQASALAMSLSFQQLSGTLERASTHYAQARTLLGYIGDYTLGLATRANRTAWTAIFSDIARRLQEVDRQRAAAATQP